MVGAFREQAVEGGRPLTATQQAAAAKFVGCFVKFLHHHHHNGAYLWLCLSASPLCGLPRSRVQALGCAPPPRPAPG